MQQYHYWQTSPSNQSWMQPRLQVIVCHVQTMVPIYVLHRCTRESVTPTTGALELACISNQLPANSKGYSLLFTDDFNHVLPIPPQLQQLCYHASPNLTL
eukprot:8817153-Ditylum_brightwellii.AAC.1